MLIEILVLLGFGCLSGVTTVLFGFGGGFITVPVVYAFALAEPDHALGAMHVAVATSTAVMVVNAGSATLAQLRTGRLRRDYLWPLIAFIGLGAVLGSFAATVADESVLRWLFVAYLALTIADSLARKGFVSRRDDIRPRALGGLTTTAGGTGIGAVASFLGVGGSVLTVPLMRRKGLPMADAAALANPLSLPVAVIGTAVYAFAATGTASGTAHLGYIDLVAAGALLCGSLPTIAVTRRVVGRIPDRAHAIAYLALLAAALIAIVVR
ncbi:permease [Amycolatopsis sp. WAC 01376]|uniref:sulfite exporter TauE/SafE family protein n=1 Tax=Amycolatopsis sp. WAC 01376 TaxID=2203195 RepID=UPI000F7874E2|nr:sulfite exporter TauE/SafE family protein [Amycolatopsis sp. WAC 01376]RSM63741.1 permease [Amycolatopsis sp. WAC 01376]